MYLLPSGSEQHEVFRVVGILIGILLYRLERSRLFYCWLKTCHYKKKKHENNLGLNCQQFSVWKFRINKQ